ncbi:hypothetical protein JTE90_026324 [Oedothorax gibbosus]|uniref:Uncharacterized protein n=1 Tax=Oedothorax gibbosus TaxID=931172 RepID=A0AAV6U6Z6_9ARAC|nr:hypothetical protein JTE90_026324 [Oedothorax gibbosus]
MKRNVVLFSLLGIGVLYLFFGTEEEHAPTEKLQLESETETPNNETALFHTRKLLSFENSNHNVDFIRTLSGSVIKDYKFAKREQLKNSRSLGLRSRKLVQRRKRNVPHPEQQYAWKFNLNVTRRESNDTFNKPDYPIQNDGIPEDRHLGMAMSVSGNGPQQSVGDLYQAWDSVGQFLRTLFGGTLDELKDKGHEVSLDISPLPNGSIQLPRELFLEGSGEEDSQELSYRRGKFLLGIFGFGGNKENPPRDEGSGEMEMQEFINTESEVQEILNSTETFSVLKTEVVPEIVSTENLRASATPSVILGRALTDNNLGTTEFTSTNSNSEETFMIGNCTDCDFQTEPFVPTDELFPTLEPIDSSTISAQVTLSDETVKTFCLALFSRMRTSGRSVEESEGSGNIENFISDVTASNALTDKPISQNIGFFESIWNRIIGRRNAVGLEEPSKDSRKARLIRFGNLFGGRSVDLEESSNIDLEELKDDFNNIEDGEQFLLDCEEFLRSTQTETRPNIFDLVDPHFPESLTAELTTLRDDKFQPEEQDIEDLNKKIDSHFESTTDNEVFTILSTISKTIDEKTPYSLYYTHPTDYQNKNFEKEEETTVLEMTELVYTEDYEKEPSSPLSIQNLVRENVTATEEIEATEKILYNSMQTNVPEEITLTTKEYSINTNEERSFNLFGFGSGRDDGSSDISNIDERIFGFGSGGREITEHEISTEDIMDKTTESSKQRSFGIFNLFGSGERAINEEVLSTDRNSELEPGTGVPLGIDFGSGARELVNLNSSDNDDIFTSTIMNEGRIFGFLGFGSGERGFPETSELETERELFFSTTKGSNADEIPSFVTSEFSVETSEKQVSLSTNIPLDETKDERSLNLNIFGSGDGRILTETEDLNDKVTSESSIIKNDADGNSSIIEFCSDCEETIFPSMEESTVEVSRVGEMSSTDSSKDNEGKIPRTGFEVTTNEARPSFPPKDEDYGTDTEISLETTTQQDKSRLFNTIFLTGSGEGGLFVDNKGPINLVQETEFTPPPVFQPPIQPRRGARRHDDSLDFPIEKVPQTTKVAPVEGTTEINVTDFQNTTDSSILENFVTDGDNETEIDLALLEIEDNWKITSDLSTPAVETESPEVSVSSTTKNITLNTSPKIDTPSSTIVTSPKIDSTTSVMISTSPKIKPRSKFIELPQRVCTSASQCNRTLNERCMSDGSTAMCNCGRSYVRSLETGKCEAPVLLTTSLKLPGESYHEDLNNKNSTRFRKLANDSIETMWILLGDDPEVFRLVAGVDVSGFEKGSLVVHWEITLAAPPEESVASLIQQVDAELKEAFADEDLLKRAPLNVQDAVVVGVNNDVNPCEKTELNYCSINAICIRDHMRGFRCLCKADYEDKSTDMNGYNQGEICTATCPLDYCGDHGECKLKQNGEAHCSCSSWYFGERCEISGIVVIGSFASFNALLIIIVLLLVCYCRKRRYRQSQFYGQNQVRFQPDSELGRFTASPRLSNAIAMNDVGPTKASKYMAISTPMHKTPTIRLTSPSILGSSVDYDYDSTFDRTPSVKEVNVEVHKSGSSPKV